MSSRRDLVRNVTGQHRKAIIKTLLQIGGSYSRSMYDVFRDFVEICAITIANRLPLSEDEHDKREKRYLEIVAQYTPEQVELFCQAFGEVALATEEEGGDVLGDVFMGANISNDASGQFFTPFEISLLLASMSGVVEGAKEKIARKEFLTVMEPCIGAGSISLATFELLSKSGIDVAKAAHLTAIDLDKRCCHMAFIQLSLRGIPAVVIHGNALSLEEYERWYTPAHITNGWFAKLGTRKDELAAARPAATAPPPLTLFPLPDELAS